MRARRSSGFTLVEILIVVVIMAVLAATIIPQFSSATNDAKVSALQFNLQSLRSQVELYKLHHLGALPTITSGALPQLTSATDVNGNIGAPGPTFPYGPYLTTSLPNEPFTNSNTVTGTTATPPTAATAAGGWYFNTNSGLISANDANYLTN